MSHDSVVRKVEENDGNISAAAREMGIPVRTVNYWYNNPSATNDIKRYVITYAQNATPVHKGFYEALQNYLSLWKAELICYRGRYKNPTSQRENRELETDDWWVSEVSPYLMDSVRELNENLLIYPARTQPTAVNPLSGYDTHTEDKSGIFPHPKVRLKTIPTPGNKLPKILTTTGAITVKNYSQSKAGEKGKQHHVIGAMVVEVVNNKVFHMRHIAAESDGSFYDIAGGSCRYYTPEGVKRNQSIDVLTMGDIHSPWVDEVALAGTYDLIEKLNPSRLYIHDLLDFWARNHHERKNRFLNTAKAIGGNLSVVDEIIKAKDFVVSIAKPKKYFIGIVTSNHDEALDRWLNEESADNLGINAAYFHKLSWLKHESAKETPVGYEFANMLETAMREFFNPEDYNVKYIKRDEPEVHNGIDYSMHGDIGPSGARGSANNLSKIGVKSVIGHGHSPQIVDGCYMVGVKCKILSYAKGPNGWLTTDCITYKNGKRTLVTYIEGKWCL